MCIFGDKQSNGGSTASPDNQYPDNKISNMNVAAKMP